MHLGIFGGSFDPVHNGHLALARACQSQAALDEVWFTPTAIQPLKHHGPHAADAQRVEMLELAIESKPSEPGRPRPRSVSEPGGGHHPSRMVAPRSVWRVYTREIDRGGYSYTVDTLRQIQVELPEARLFFIMGADAVRDVPHWKEPAEIFMLATPLVVHRAGQPEPDLSELAQLCAADNPPRHITMPAIDISSTDIRRRVAAGEPIDRLVPPAVAEYIAKHGLYR